MTVLVLAVAWAAMIATVRVTAARTAPDPWRAAGFAEWFAGWVEQQSTADHLDRGPAVAELERVAAVLLRSAAPARPRPRVV